MIHLVLAGLIGLESVRDGVRAAVPVCSTVRTAKYAVQAYDLINTETKLWRPGPPRYERDPITGALGKRSALGILVMQVALDVVSDALTRRSPVLRCAADARQLDANMGGIVESNH